MAANKVIRSIEAPGGLVCVDVFRRPDGTFGFEHYRREPEDGRGWFAIGYFSDQIFPDAETALSAAIRNVPWLK